MTPATAACLEWAGQQLVVQVEDVQHQRLQGVGGDEAVVCSQDTALVIAPGLHLQSKSNTGPGQPHDLPAQALQPWTKKVLAVPCLQLGSSLTAAQVHRSHDSW